MLPITPDHELEQYRHLDAFTTQLRQARDVQKTLGYALRVVRTAFRASEACVAVLSAGRRDCQVIASFPPRTSGWDVELMAAFIRGEHPNLPPEFLLAPIRRRGRSWAALALRRAEPFERDTFRKLSRFTAALADALQRIDRERLLEIRDQIDQKFLEQLRPQDLFYEILHGLRTLTRYDHSSALLIQEDASEGLKLVAEQIAWTKGKSRRIGQKFLPDEETKALMAGGSVYGFERNGDEWREWQNRPVTGLAQLLDYNDSDGPDVREGAMIVAPLATRDGLFGVLKIAALHPATFSRHEAHLLERFRSQAAQAIQNARRTESLHTRMLEAEKKHAMADLARGVSHDVNNALGSVLPIVQEMQEDLKGGRFDPGVFAADLEQVLKSLQVCRRIFGGMLSFATRGARRSPEGRLAPALEGPLAILQPGLDRRGIRLEIALPEDIPAVAGGQSDLEQLFLNLITNAREAIPDGGVIGVAARENGGKVEIEITDTGCGIPAEHLERIQEPFFTTKPDGNGLGLSICRSIVWEMNGRISFESREGEGTRVRVLLPAAPVLVEDPS